MKTKLWIAALCLLAAFFFVLPARNARAESPTDAVKRTAKMIREAVAQYTAGDHTPLDEPVTYRMLWLGYTRVYYDQLDFRMTEADREYLRAVRNNFILYVENITNHCLKVEIDL